VDEADRGQDVVLAEVDVAVARLEIARPEEPGLSQVASSSGKLVTPISVVSKRAPPMTFREEETGMSTIVYQAETSSSPS
jgi:hypothetical protein